MSAQAVRPPIAPSSLISMTGCKVVGLISPSIIPLLVPALIKSYGLTAAGAGLMVSYQMASLALCGFLVSLIVHRIDRRAGAALALGVILLGNLLCLFGGSVASLIAGRVVVGAGEGALTAITIAAASTAHIPERVFAIFAVAIGLVGAILLYLLPGLIGRYGAGGVFGAMIVLVLLVLPTLLWFPARSGEIAAPGEVRGSLFSLGATAGLTLLSATVFSVGLGAMTSYIGVIGYQVGASTASIGKMLAAGSVLAIAAPMTVVAIGGRAGRLWPMLLAGALLAAVAVAIGNAGMAWLYFGAGVLFNPTTLFLSPYQYGLMARLDPKGRIGAAAPTFIKIGFAAGAAGGGYILDLTSRQALGLFSGAWIAVGMALYCLMAAKSDRMAAVASPLAA